MHRRLRMATMSLAALAGLAAALPQSALAGGFGGPEGAVQRSYSFTTGPGENQVSASRQLRFGRSWSFSLISGASDVTDAAISVDSGYPATDFTGVSAFPVMQSQALVTAGSSLDINLSSSIVTTSTTGYDSSRSFTPRSVLPGGGQQLVTIKLDLTDARYAAGGDYSILVPMDVAGETGSCGTTTAPSGSPFAETTCSVDPSGSVIWNGCVSNCDNSLQLNDPVTFTVLLDVPNGADHPVTHVAPVEVGVHAGGIGGFDTCTGVGPASGFTVAEPSLDGGTSGAGSVSFSIGQSDLEWLSCPIDLYTVNFPGK